MRISDWSSDVCSSDLLFSRLPGGFLPQEDQGTVITVVQAPPGATRERTEEAVRQVKEFYNQQDIVTSVFVVRGFSFFGQGQANGMMFTMLKPWEERSGEENSSLALVGKAMGFFTSIKEAMVFALNPPAIAELGIAGGFTFK